MSALDDMCRAAHHAGKVVLWDGRALAVVSPPMTEKQRANLDAAIRRAKGKT